MSRLETIVRTVPLPISCVIRGCLPGAIEWHGTEETGSLSIAAHERHADGCPRRPCCETGEVQG